MFEKLRNAFSVAVKSFGDKELKEKDIDEVLFELEVALLESDVATEVIDALKDDLKKQLIGTTVNKDKIAEVVKQELRKSISNMFDVAGTVDILSNIQKKKDKGEPYIISFMGINGTGKTTTIAKIANLLRENKYSVVIAAADTYRAGAIEQIGEHGKRLNIKVISQNYGSDPAAVARDAVLYSKSHKIDCILIDTAGRMQTSKNLMDQISKINKVVNPDLKLFVGDSLAGNDTVSQAREFYNYTKFDGAILTKSDADARGGAAISIVKVTSSPILYLGIGQEYKDLKSFDKDIFLETLFGPEEIIESVQKKVLEPKVESKPEIIVAKEPEKQILEEDPFAGISTKDVEKYSNLFDVPPPENDDQARKLASNIRKWISEGRPKKQEQQVELKTTKEEIEEIEDEKPKKKRSLFGWMKK
jgi:fused signal recognition particle receptor